MRSKTIIVKNLFIVLPVIGTLLLTSCKKEPETIIQTVNESIALILEPFDQMYYSSLGLYSGVEIDYSATNLGDKEISTLEVKFEAKTSDGSVYVGSDFFFDLSVGAKVSSQGYIDVADKECVSVKIKELEITTY